MIQARLRAHDWHEARDQAQSRERDALLAGKEAAEARDALARQAAGLYFDRGLDLAEAGEPDKGVHWMAHALRVGPDDTDFRRVVRTNLAAWGGQLHRLTSVFRHPARLRGASISPDGRTVLTACEDERARLWDAAGGNCIWESDALGGPVFAVAFSPDGRRFATGACEATLTGRATVLVWDRAPCQPVGRPIRLPSYVRSVAWSPDGKILATTGGVASDGAGVRFWEAATGEPCGTPITGDLECRALAWSPDGRTVATCDGTEYTREPRPVRCWDAAGRAGLTFPHPRAVAALAFSPDGRTLLTGCDDGAARLWDTGTGKPLGEPLPHPDKIHAVAFTPDGQQFLTACDDGLVRFWDTAARRENEAPARHPDKIRAAAVSPDGRVLVTASFDHTARVWELSRQPPAPVNASIPAAARGHGSRRELSEPRSRRFRTAVFGPGGREVAVVRGDGRLARILSVAEARPVGLPIRNAREITPLNFFDLSQPERHPNYPHRLRAGRPRRHGHARRGSVPHLEFGNRQAPFAGSGAYQLCGVPGVQPGRQAPRRRRLCQAGLPLGRGDGPAGWPAVAASGHRDVPGVQPGWQDACRGHLGRLVADPSGSPVGRR